MNPGRDYLDLEDDEVLALTPPPCPACGDGATVVPRIFGMPSEDNELERRVARGEVAVEFAGCVIPAGVLPIWSCRRCHTLLDEGGAPVPDEPEGDAPW